MEAVEIYGANWKGKYAHIREACRGIIVEDGKILLCYEPRDDQFMIPGGGLEEGESYEECCARELAEETGDVINVSRYALTINEYYGDWLFISHYFMCERVGKTERNLTQSELNVGLEPVWLPVLDAINAFSKYESYVNASNKMKSGMYLREYKALSSIFKVN